MKKQPLAEVFGYPISNVTEAAKQVRENTLCPYNNKVAKCTKNSKKHPLGVCSVFEGDDPTITCPIRFREDWIIREHAAQFFFGSSANCKYLSEIRLNDKSDNSAGNIDHVIVKVDKNDHVVDFGSLEVQGVYISGNVSNPFKHYMTDPAANTDFDWRDEEYYPTADFLSSSRKRLVPQLRTKGDILKKWKKKMAVAVDMPFFNTLPTLKTVSEKKAEIAWFIYELKHDKLDKRYHLIRKKTVYTEFESALETLAKVEAGDVDDFIDVLQGKVDGIAPPTDDPDPTVDSEHDVA